MNGSGSGRGKESGEVPVLSPVRAQLTSLANFFRVIFPPVEPIHRLKTN